MFPFFPDHQLNWQGHFKKVLVGCITRKFNLTCHLSFLCSLFFSLLLYDFVSLVYLYFTPSASCLSLLPINTSVHTGNKEEIKSPGCSHSFSHKYCHFRWNHEEIQLEEYPCHPKRCLYPKNHRHSPHSAPAKQHSITKTNTVAQDCVDSEAATGSGIKSRDSRQPRHKANVIGNANIAPLKIFM